MYIYSKLPRASLPCKGQKTYAYYVQCIFTAYKISLFHPRAFTLTLNFHSYAYACVCVASTLSLSFLHLRRPRICTHRRKIFHLYFCTEKSVKRIFTLQRRRVTSLALIFHLFPLSHSFLLLHLFTRRKKERILRLLCALVPYIRAYTFVSV